MILRARQFEFVFPRPALLMGMVNVTPDSFYDGGRFATAAAAVGHALCNWRRKGRISLTWEANPRAPGRQPVSEAEELRRVIPVIENWRAGSPFPFPLTRSKPGGGPRGVAGRGQHHQRHRGQSRGRGDVARGGGKRGGLCGHPHARLAAQPCRTIPSMTTWWRRWTSFLRID